jgi:hypothetical protein
VEREPGNVRVYHTTTYQEGRSTMPSLLPERRKVNGRELLATAITEALAAVQRQMSERLNQLLAQGVDHLLGRAACVRRAAQQVTCGNNPGAAVTARASPTTISAATATGPAP